MNGAISFMVKIGQPSSYQFSVSDSDSFALNILGNLSGTLERNSEAHMFTVYLAHVTTSTVSFVARDSLNASSLLDPQVLICACQNDGNCTLEGVLNRDADPLIMNCVCPEGTLFAVMFNNSYNTAPLGFTGQFCEEDFDGCSEMSCFDGVTCTDNPAPQTRATCGPCPAGLVGDGNKCIGR